MREDRCLLLLVWERTGICVSRGSSPSQVWSLRASDAEFAAWSKQWKRSRWGEMCEYEEAEWLAVGLVNDLH
jgi:hypothetical protein